VKTQEQVAVIGEFPLEAWEDVPMRETLWATLRARAAEVATSRPGWVLTNTPEVRSDAMYMRIADGVGEPMEVETTRERAEYVKLRLACWAEAK
jgi:hypothetical protein